LRTKHDRTDDEEESLPASGRAPAPPEKRGTHDGLAMWLAAGLLVASVLISLAVLWLAIKGIQWLFQ
jgi:hypothetical protein